MEISLTPCVLRAGFRPGRVSLEDTSFALADCLKLEARDGTSQHGASVVFQDIHEAMPFLREHLRAGGARLLVKVQGSLLSLTEYLDLPPSSGETRVRSLLSTLRGAA